MASRNCRVLNPQQLTEMASLLNYCRLKSAALYEGFDGLEAPQKRDMAVML